MQAYISYIMTGVGTSQNDGVEWNGMEWNGMEWSGMEWNGVEVNKKVCCATMSGPEHWQIG